MPVSRVVVRGGELQDRTARNGKRLRALVLLRRGAGPRPTKLRAGAILRMWTGPRGCSALGTWDLGSQSSLAGSVKWERREQWKNDPMLGGRQFHPKKKRKKEIFTVHREQYMLRLLHSEKLTFDMLIPKSPYNQSYSKKSRSI